MELTNPPAGTQTPAASETPETTQAQTAQAQEQPQEPQYVTKEQLDSIRAEIIRDVTKRDKQRAQAIRQELDTLKKRLEAAGNPVTPELESKLYDQIADSMDDGEEVEVTPQQPAPASDIPAEVLPALAWMKKQGVIIADSDPEFTEHLKPVLDTAQLDQVEISLAMAKAVEAKRARIALQQGKATLRTPAGGGGSPAAETFTSARDAWARAHKK